MRFEYASNMRFGEGQNYLTFLDWFASSSANRVLICVGFAFLRISPTFFGLQTITYLWLHPDG
jgi:hypothetical protein